MFKHYPISQCTFAKSVNMGQILELPIMCSVRATVRNAE